MLGSDRIIVCSSSVHSSVPGSVLLHVPGTEIALLPCITSGAKDFSEMTSLSDWRIQTTVKQSTKTSWLRVPFVNGYFDIQVQKKLSKLGLRPYKTDSHNSLTSLSHFLFVRQDNLQNRSVEMFSYTKPVVLVVEAKIHAFDRPIRESVRKTNKS